MSFHTDPFDYTEYLGFADPKEDRSILYSGKNVPRTQSLLLETAQYEPKEGNYPMYTMRDYAVTCPHSGLVLPSAKQIFLHSVDEYDAAVKLVGSWEHWKKLSENNLFNRGVNSTGNGIVVTGLANWREELEMRRRSMALRSVITRASEGDLNAAKTILAFDAHAKKGKRTAKDDNVRNKRINKGAVSAFDQHIAKLTENL